MHSRSSSLPVPGQRRRSPSLLRHRYHPNRRDRARFEEGHSFDVESHEEDGDDDGDGDGTSHKEQDLVEDFMRWKTQMTVSGVLFLVGSQSIYHTAPFPLHELRPLALSKHQIESRMLTICLLSPEDLPATPLVIIIRLRFCGR